MHSLDIQFFSCLSELIMNALICISLETKELLCSLLCVPFGLYCWWEEFNLAWAETFLPGTLIRCTFLPALNQPFHAAKIRLILFCTIPC